MSLDHQIADAVADATKQISAQIEERLRGLATDIGQAASAERVSIVREIRLAAEAEVARKSQEAVASFQAEQTRRLDEAVAAARAEGAQRVEEAMVAARSDQARRIDEAVATARADLQKRVDEAVAAARVEWARQHDAEIGIARAAAAREAEAELTGRHSVALADAVVAARAEAVREAKRDHERRLEETVGNVRAEAASTLADTLRRVRMEADARLAESVETARREAAAQAQRTVAETQAAAAQSLIEIRAAERQAVLAQVERIADDVRRLDGARSLTEVLEWLADSVAASAPRVAMFIVRGGRIAGWRLAGFPEKADPRQLECGVDDPGLVSRAVRAGQRVTTSDREDGPAGVATPFGALPEHRAGLAVPIRIGGETVAVLYADDASADGHETPSVWPEVAEILCRHAARCLEVVTVTRAVQTLRPVPDVAPPPRYAQQGRPGPNAGPEDDDAARRYAKLLVSEIKLYHEAAVSQGRRDRNLIDRLRPEIDRARRLYEERVPAPIRARTDHFGQELLRTLASGDASLLGGR